MSPLYLYALNASATRGTELPLSDKLLSQATTSVMDIAATGASRLRSTERRRLTCYAVDEYIPEGTIGKTIPQCKNSCTQEQQQSEGRGSRSLVSWGDLP